MEKGREVEKGADNRPCPCVACFSGTHTHTHTSVYGWATGNWTMFGSYNQIIIQFTGETRPGSDAPGEVVNYAVNYRNKILELWREDRLVNC